MLLDHPDGIAVTKMYEEMKKRFDVGRGSTDTSRKILTDAGLLSYEEKDTGAPRNIHAYRLTKLGLQAAEMLRDLRECMLDRQ